MYNLGIYNNRTNKLHYLTQSENAPFTVRKILHKLVVAPIQNMPTTLKHCVRS